MMDLWMAEGILQDPYDEFFVSAFRSNYSQIKFGRFREPFVDWWLYTKE